MNEKALWHILDAQNTIVCLVFMYSKQGLEDYVYTTLFTADFFFVSNPFNR